MSGVEIQAKLAEWKYRLGQHFFPVPESDNVCFYSQRPREDNILRYDLGDHTDSLDYCIQDIVPVPESDKVVFGT